MAGPQPRCWNCSPKRASTARTLPRAFALNRCAARTIIARETAETLAEHDPPVLASTIGQRVVFAQAAQSGQLAAELDETSPAAREIAALLAEIERLRVGAVAP